MGEVGAAEDRDAFSQVASLELERKLTSGHSALQQKLAKSVCRGVLELVGRREETKANVGGRAVRGGPRVSSSLKVARWLSKRAVGSAERPHHLSSYVAS